MRTFIAVAAILLAVISAAVGARAAYGDSSEVIHLEFSGTFSEPDFCGTGVAVHIDDSVHATLFIASQPTADERLTLEGRTVFTNAQNGETVVAHFAGARRMVFPGEPGREIHTDVGLRTQIVHRGSGGLVSRDAGSVTIDFTFSVVGGTIVVERGAHPFLGALISGDDVFCALVTPGLGIG